MTDNRLYAVLLIAVVVLLAGCIGDSGDRAPQTDDGEPSPDTSDTDSSGTDGDGDNVIRFTDNGFQPADLTIEQGETVTFIDESSQTMWVASNQHPTHTEYQGTSLNEHCGTDAKAFDQCSTGERYEFTFEKTGEWDYHNHKPFIRGGTITVQ